MGETRSHRPGQAAATDDRYARQNPADKRVLDLTPSGYFDRNLFFTIVKDAYGIRNRHEVGVDRILWSSDYPHATCAHPHYDAAIESDFAGVPEEERRKILGSTATRIYGWETPS